jgi:hypothetical protein
MLTPDWNDWDTFLKHLRDIRLQVDDGARQKFSEIMRWAVALGQNASWATHGCTLAHGIFFYRGHLGVVCALSTLPALESVDLGHRRAGKIRNKGWATVLDPKYIAILSIAFEICRILSQF